MRKKIIAMLLSVTMTAALLSGCGNSGSTSEPAQSEDVAQTEAADEGTSETTASEDSAAEGTETAESEAGGVKSSLAAP